MQVTKIGHCCMLIEESGTKIITDPGVWSNLTPADINNIDAVLITHEHADHFYPESIKNILSQNSQARFISNSSVALLLKELGITCEILDPGMSTQVGKINVEAVGGEHAEIYGSYGKVKNTGYLVGEKLFYPGDAFTLLEKPVKALALPVCGPWLHIKETINYALHIKPEHAFPVHDGMLKIYGPFHALPEKLLSEKGINFFVPELGKPFTIN